MIIRVPSFKFFSFKKINLEKLCELIPKYISKAPSQLVVKTKLQKIEGLDCMTKN